MHQFELPGYEVLEQVGHGAMATVWRARQVSLDRIVAIKILSSHLSHDAQAIEQFRSESKAAAQLKHPGIVQVYDAGEHGALVYYVMEFIDGCTVGELLKIKGRMEEKPALQIADGVARALHHAWSEGRIIHCDIKPENVMVDRDGSIKVADLGLARIMGRYTRQPSDTVSGTPNYISPEQASGEPELDCRTDIYSLGAMLYHMVVGQTPFGGLSEQQIMEGQVHGHLPDPTETVPALSLELGWLMEKLMIKDRNLRTADWKEVWEDIQAVMNGQAPSPLPAKDQSTVLRSARRESLPVKKKSLASKTAGGRTSAGDASPKQKIVLSKKEFASKTSPEKQGKPDVAGSLLTLVLLAGLVAAGVLGFRFWMSSQKKEAKAPRQEQSEGLPPRSALTGQKMVPGAAVPVLAERAKVEKARPLGVSAAPEGGPSKGGAVSWKDPEFQKGARAFNEALDLYKRFQAERQDRTLLEKSEELARQAVNIFEARKRYAPPDVQMDTYIQQAYHLIADCRHSTLLTPGLSGSKKPSRSVPSAAPTPPPAPEPTGLMLAANWDGPLRGDQKAAAELKLILSEWCAPGVDISPAPSIYLFGHISYLLAAPDAARMGNQRLGARKPVAGTGFPLDSLGYYSLRGDYGQGFKELFLITDLADQVVAVQLVDDSPADTLWLEPHFFQGGPQIYDFVQGRAVPSSKTRVGRRVMMMNRLVRIDSDLAETAPDGLLVVSKARTSLILPEPVANLMLFHLEKSVAP